MVDGLISFIMPTTGRKDRAIRCVERLIETTQGYDIEIICPVDVDVVTGPALEAISERTDIPILVLWSDRYHGLPKSWNRGLSESRGEYIVFAADDLWWGNAWLDEAMKVMHTLPEGGGVVGFNDKTRHSNNSSATHYMTTRWFILNHMGGCIGFECYNRYANDSEACFRAGRVGRYRLARGAIVLHQQQNDETRLAIGDRYSHSQANKKRDQALFMNRAQQGFPDDFEPAITE